MIVCAGQVPKRDSMMSCSDSDSHQLDWRCLEASELDAKAAIKQASYLAAAI